MDHFLGLGKLLGTERPTRGTRGRHRQKVLLSFRWSLVAGAVGRRGRNRCSGAGAKHKHSLTTLRDTERRGICLDDGDAVSHC